MGQEIHNEVEIATPEQQRAAIDVAILERLGEDWRKEWIIVHDANDLVRLHQGEINLDFQADLLADVEIIEREANPIQLGGRMIAIMILMSFLFVALAIASLAGILSG